MKFYTYDIDIWHMHRSFRLISAWKTRGCQRTEGKTRSIFPYIETSIFRYIETSIFRYIETSTFRHVEISIFRYINRSKLLARYIEKLHRIQSISENSVRYASKYRYWNVSIWYTEHPYFDISKRSVRYVENIYTIYRKIIISICRNFRYHISVGIELRYFETFDAIRIPGISQHHSP